MEKQKNKIKKVRNKRNYFNCISNYYNCTFNFSGSINCNADRRKWNTKTSIKG